MSCIPDQSYSWQSSKRFNCQAFSCFIIPCLYVGDSVVETQEGVRRINTYIKFWNAGHDPLCKHTKTKNLRRVPREEERERDELLIPGECVLIPRKRTGWNFSGKNEGKKCGAFYNITFIRHRITTHELHQPDTGLCLPPSWFVGNRGFQRSVIMHYPPLPPPPLYPLSSSSASI